MKDIRILIVEDEPIIADDISYILEEIGYGVSGIAHDAQETLLHLEIEKPALVLLDINLEGDPDGVFVAQKLHDTFHIPFIFLTSLSDKRTLDRAKITEPYGYLVKPVDERDLSSSIAVALHNHEIRRTPAGESNFVMRDAIFIKDRYRLVKVPLNDILFAEASNNYCVIHTVQRRFVLSVTLKIVAEKLESLHFIRIHRSYMINPKHILEVGEGFVQILEHKLPVSRSYHNSLMQILNTL
jgi:DNA-binding LytR/AlgR family response regulator